MPWGLLLIALAACFSTVVAFHLHKKTDRLKFLGLLLASILIVLVSVASILEPLVNSSIAQFAVSQIIEWGHVYSLALILSSLLLFVRESKPEFSRFPISYVAFPVLIVLSYLFLYDTIILKDWLVNIYHGGAVIVSLLIYGIYNYREPIYKTVFIGSVLFCLTYILYFMVPPSYEVLWQIALAVSIVTQFSGYLIVDKHFDAEY